MPICLSTGYAAGELEPPLQGLPVLNKPYGPTEVVGFVHQLIEAEEDAA